VAAVLVLGQRSLSQPLVAKGLLTCVPGQPKLPTGASGNSDNLVNCISCLSIGILPNGADLGGYFSCTVLAFPAPGVPIRATRLQTAMENNDSGIPVRMDAQ